MPSVSLYGREFTDARAGVRRLATRFDGGEEDVFHNQVVVIDIPKLAGQP
jgi:hypothetical protein